MTFHQGTFDAAWMAHRRAEATEERIQRLEQWVRELAKEVERLSRELDDD